MASACSFGHWALVIGNSLGIWSLEIGHLWCYAPAMYSVAECRDDCEQVGAEETSMKSQRCPSRENLAAFALGKLPEDQSNELAEHASDCPECQDQLRK